MFNEKLILCISLIFILSGCAASTKSFDSTSTAVAPVTKFFMSPETAKQYQSWVDAQLELKKVEKVIGYNVNEYLENHADAIYLSGFYQYDDALKLVAAMPPIYDKTAAEIAGIKEQKDFPEIGQMKTLLAEMMRLEKISAEYLGKHIQAAKDGQSAVQKQNENLYVKYYKDAMAHSRTMMDVYAKTLIRGGNIAGKKLVEENTPPKK